jgi:hypothetical protein
MKCDDTKLLLMDFLYDEIAHEDAQRVREHLALCSNCRAEYAALQRTSLTLRAWPDEEPGQNLVFVENRPSWRGAVKQVLFPERAPLWGRLGFGLGVAVITALFMSAIFNLEINYNNGQLTYRAGLAPRPVVELTEEAKSRLAEQIRQENQEMIARLVQAGYEQQRDELERTLVGLTSELHRQRQNDLLLVGRGIDEIRQSTDTRLQQTNRILDQLIRVNAPQR